MEAMVEICRHEKAEAKEMEVVITCRNKTEEVMENMVVVI